MRVIRSISKYWYIFLLFTVLVFAAYTNSLGNGFVSDDHGLEKVLPSINMQYLISQPFVFFRNVVYIAVYTVFGLTPWAFRLVNILFHLGNTVLAFLILKKTINQTVAFLAATIFAVHPLTVESVAWIAGGVYPQYGFFFLLSLFLYLHTTKNGLAYFCSTFFYILALLSSDKALPLFLLFVFAEWTSGNIKTNWKRLVPFVMITAVASVIFLSGNPFVQRTSELIADYYQPGGYDNPLLQIPSAFSSYFELFLWPEKLTLYHTELLFPAGEFFIRIIATIAFLSIGTLAFVFHKKLAFWFLFFIIPLTPSLTPLRIAWMVAERYAYLSILAMAVMTSWILSLLIKQKRYQGVLIVFCVVWIGALMARTIWYNTAWKTDDVLWLAIDKYSPSSAQNHNNLGDLYARRKEYQRSIEEYEKALKINPRYGDVYNNLANTYSHMGQFEKAIELYEKALSLNPSLWQTYQNIAAIYVNNKQYPQAVAYMEKASKVRPELSRVWANLGVTYVLSGQTDKAKVALTHALQLNPNEKGAQEALGLLR